MLSKMANCVDLFKREKNHKLIYSQHEYHSLTELWGLDNEYFTSPIDSLTDVLSNCDSYEEKNTSHHHILDISKLTIEPVSDSSILKAIPIKHAVKIVLFDPAKKYYPIISIITSSYNGLSPPKLANVDVIHDKESLEKWVRENRQQRTMNKNNKHGENGKGGHPHNKGDPVSVLKCNIEKAQGLLNTAKCLGATYNRHLVNYDPEFGELIIFYDEGDNPQNQYHGYHIAEKDIKKKYPNAADELKELKSDKVKS